MFSLKCADEADMIIERGKTYRVFQVIQQLRESYDQLIPMKMLASKIGVSISTLHHSFKEVTGMSPLQFQKHIRLQEARRLMISQDITAEQACFEVGYNSPSQFNREYRRMFGISPGRDIKRLRSQ